MPIEFEVTGVPETTKALHDLDSIDYGKAEQDAGQAVLGNVISKTRRETGNLAGAWTVDGGEFINREDYASYQEFGTQFIPATFAIFKAWDEGQAQIEKVFEQEITHAASQIGFNTR